ncbi:hypothetical protein GRI89_07235 [Altererythrobacter salegens]|uniref:Uncharacterized protein n=1 Tax=Croceibacterium salegens TaxID=1737568 RepID=A0A6I4SU00_9SPHN|nr:hypothetical protein [Croceibacterium salegens]MXO59333.1 hypothetical protein [Croceibacterium salegens]
MQINWRRAIVATLFAEAAGIVALMAIVAVFGPSGWKEATPFAQQMGALVGPVSGFLLCMIGGWWTGRLAPPDQRVKNGLAMGCIAAAFDIALSFALGGGLVGLLVVSNIGRIVAGTLGGWLGMREG